MNIEQDWIKDAALQELLVLLERDGGEARVAGGAVRNALLDEPIKDVDVATTLTPDIVTNLLEEAGHRAIPTGIEHGTVTGLVSGKVFEITTLRRDVETDGRHAKVVFGTDWEADARRRDFTMNALYVDKLGKVHDPLGGYEDLMARQVRFIDDPAQRIREDGLRILRFFRFFAWYGSFRPDAEGLKACVRLKDRLDDLSSERIWQELSRLLEAPDPTKAILWMRQTGVLAQVLPEGEKWGIDGIHGLVETEKNLQWSPDAVLRLLCILPPMMDKLNTLAVRLKLSSKVRDRILNWAHCTDVSLKFKRADFEQFLYGQNLRAVEDRLRLSIAKYAASGGEKKAKKLNKRLKQLAKWQRPEFPLRGQDLIDRGHKPGPDFKNILSKLEDKWVKSHFALSRDFLLSKLDDLS